VKRISSWLGALVLVAPLTAMAETDLATVDKVQRSGPQFMQVTGIPVGGSQAQLNAVLMQDVDSQNACERFALIAMTHPGRYTFSYTSNSCSLGPKQ
jgi:hypothetical protein